MKRFVEGVGRGQGTLFPERLEDWIGDDNPVQVIDVFVEEPDLGGLGKSWPIRPREPNKSPKPENPSRQIIQTHSPVTQKKWQTFLHRLDP